MCEPGMNPPLAGVRYRNREPIEAAKAAIKRGVMARYIDLPIVSIEVSDEDARRYIDGASIAELIA
jgi:hypothetical protein